MADSGNSQEAINILTELLDKSPDAFTFRFRFLSLNLLLLVHGLTFSRAELRILRQDFEGAKSGIPCFYSVRVESTAAVVDWMTPNRLPAMPGTRTER